MAPPRRTARIDVVPASGATAADALVASTVLVVDVLRASTTIVAALANGCAAVIPVADAEAARARRAGAGDGALLAGERGGERIPGFDLGNSPLEFVAARVSGRTVILTTTNGTRALLAAAPAAAVGIAAFVNLTAAARWAAARGTDITVLCAGQEGRHSLEDHVCAGLLVDRLLVGLSGATLTGRAEEALHDGRRYGTDVARLADDSPWARRLAAAGYRADVAACLALDTTALVPTLLPGLDKVVGSLR
ncbi:MAG: 2-phosphosulfolactate phosphatase [Candidatus Rokubacteria bacterium]|nr:2-phosphosulfolactate phosphatase [Candidatus Rokubacteria bacterium]